MRWLREWFRLAANEFAKAQLPLEAARAQLAFAEMVGDELPDVARAEAKAALDCFVRLQAAGDVDAGAAVLRSLGLRVAPSREAGGGLAALSSREVEGVDLLGYGLSNPEIAGRLFISRKTVEHHVANVLSKLGLRTRVGAIYGNQAAMDDFVSINAGTLPPEVFFSPDYIARTFQAATVPG